MDDVFEYRLPGRRRAVWLAAIIVVFLIGISGQFQAPEVVWFAWLTLAVMLGWMLMAQPSSGIRVDYANFTVSAWHHPRDIPLAEIDHIRVRHWTEDSDITIVLRNGDEIDVGAGDLPPIPVLEDVMIARGVPVRDPVK